MSLSKAGLFLLLIIVCSGCLPIHRVNIERPFEGLAAKVNETSGSGGILRILVVHGMGIHPEGYSFPLITRAISLSHLNLYGPPERVEIRDKSHFYGALNIQSYASGTRKMKVYELTWSPTTEYIKRHQFEIDMQESRSRQLVNDALKQSLVDLSLSDAVLYAGTFREQMRYPIKVAINRMIADGFEDGDQIAMVSFSLGSYMLLDTIAAMAKPEPNRDTTLQRNSMEELVAHTSQIYMLANQVPLLELSNLEVPTEDRFRTATQPGTDVLERFIELKSIAVAGRKVPRAILTKFQVVSFSDPNDLLSYTLNKTNLASNYPSISVNPVNVSMIIEPWSILGIVANPAVAHTNWDMDNRALDLLIFGYPSKSR